jgi:hypothetical protein
MIRSESLHFVGLAISACLLPSLPRPTCTAHSSAALTATAPVRSLVHAWPCSAPLQPLLPLPFPALTLLVIFCAHLTFHHSLSCPISYFPPGFPYAFLTGLCPFWHISALTLALSTFHLSVCPARGTVGNVSFYSFQRAQEHSNLTNSPHCCMSRAEYTNSSRARTDNRMNSVIQLYSVDLGTFRVALLICYPQRCWNFVIVIQVLRRVNPATPYGNPGCQPPSNPTKCRKLGL